MTRLHSPLFNWPVRVYWEDTDAGGIVYYANYLKFFERARTEWLRSLGISQHALSQSQGGMFVVSQAELRYLSPARLDDELNVSTQRVALGRASLSILQQVSKINCSGPNTVLCEGTIRVGWMAEANFKLARIPPTVMEVLK